MKNLLMKMEFEDFLQNHGYVLDEDEFWTKECAKIRLDFVDEEGDLCLYSTSCEYAKVTDKYLVIYDALDPNSSETLIETFRVELKQIKSATISVEYPKQIKSATMSVGYENGDY